MEWEPVDLGTEGRLHSFTVHHRPLPPGFEQPFIVGLIEFDDGTRMVTNVIGIEEEDLVLDEVLEVVFVDQDEGWTAPLFRRPAPR